ncbi:MAG: substrate-binding domain-containing protein [Cyanobacteria bacterium P01_F01_bin.150]
MLASEYLIRPYLGESVVAAQTSTLISTLLAQTDETLILRMDGSNSVASENLAIQEFLESQGSKVRIELQYRGTDAALQALQNGQIDIAAIGRPLTEQERSEGLETITLPRRKIAIVVGEENPFQNNLDIRQFAKIFRGEISNWNEVGGSNQTIRFIDHPSISDTRQNFRNYPVFQQAEFETGDSAEQVLEANAEAIINELGNDGISYLVVDQAVVRPELRILTMHNVSVIDPRYPFSQPRYYSYKDLSNPAVQYFIQAIAELNLISASEAKALKSDFESNSDTVIQEDSSNSSQKNSEIIKIKQINIFLTILLLLSLLGITWLLGKKYYSKVRLTKYIPKKENRSPLLQIVNSSNHGEISSDIKPNVSDDSLTFSQDYFNNSLTDSRVYFKSDKNQFHLSNNIDISNSTSFFTGRIVDRDQISSFSALQTEKIEPEDYESNYSILDSETYYIVDWVTYPYIRKSYSNKVASTVFPNQISNTIIIDIDATKNNQDHSVVHTLPLGIYDVRVIGQAKGGKYDAWSRGKWTYGCDINGESCINGWENSYLIVSKEFFVKIDATGIYNQPLQALTKAQNTSFTLVSKSEVYFFIYDEQLSDNRGGISLAITRTTSPESQISPQESLSQEDKFQKDKEEKSISQTEEFTHSRDTSIPIARKPTPTFTSSQENISLQERGKRIIMTAYGSLGDVYPYMAIAKGLKARGHCPVIATSESFRHNIEAENIEFCSIRPDISFLAQQQDWEWVNALRECQREIEHDICYNLMPHLRSSFIDLKQATQAADLLITHPLSFSGYLVAKTAEIPWISTVLSPLSMMSAYDLPGKSPPSNSAYENALRLVSNDALLRFNQWQARHWSGPIRQLSSELELEPSCDPVFEGKHSPHLVLALFSPLLASPQLDWPSQTRMTGFPFYHRLTDQQCSPELHHFLDTGEPPIVFTLGSSAVWTPGNFYLTSIRAAEALGYRAVLLMGPSANNITANELPKGVIAVDYIPHSVILPRAAAIVHHGGVGTTGQALRSGKPMLVVPFTHDQPDNAARLARLGVGRTINHCEYTADRAIVELKEILFNPRYAARAVEISKLMDLENGVQTTCNLIETFLQEFRCKKVNGMRV